jgi:thioester reductase-like protein
VPSFSCCCAPKTGGKLGARSTPGKGSDSRRVVAVGADLTAKKPGVSAEAIRELKGKVDHLHHLAAVNDLTADAASQIANNIEGTRTVVELAKAIDAGHLRHVS